MGKSELLADGLAPAPSVRTTLSHPGVLWFVGGAAISTLGDFALFIAAGVWVKQLTGSSAQAGLTFFFFALGGLAGPTAGLLVDRTAHRPLLIAANLASAAILAPLVLVHNAGGVWLIDLVMAVYGFAGTVVNAGNSALLPTLVTEDLLGDVNGLQQTLSQGLRLVGPGLGVGLLELGGGAGLALADAATFVIAAFTLLPLHPRATPPTEPSDEHWLTQASAGFRMLLRTQVLRQIAVSCALAIFVIGFMESLDLSVVTQGIRHSASYLGVLVTVQGITAIIGGLTSAPLVRRMSEGMLIALGLLTIALGVGLYAVPSTPSVVAGEILIGFGIPWILVGTSTAVQRNTPGDMLGRVASAFGIAISAPQAAGVALGAALTTVLFYRFQCYVIITVVASAAIYLGSRRAQRPASRSAGSPAQGELHDRGIEPFSRQFGHRRASDHRERQVNLREQAPQDMADSALSPENQPVHIWPAVEDRVGAEREGLDHVRTGPDAGVEQHWDGSPGRCAHRGQCVKGGDSAVELATAMVGHHHAVRAGVHGPPGVIGVQDSLDQDGQAGLVPEPGQIRPAESRIGEYRFPVPDDLGRPGVLGEGCPKHRIAGEVRDAHLVQERQVAIVEIRRAVAEGGCIHGQHQCRVATCLCPAH
jgi:MFS family permease